MENFRKLRVWQSAKEIAVKTYLLTRESELSKDFGLKDQIQRSAVSIASNIAVGDELGSDRLPARRLPVAVFTSASAYKLPLH